MKTEELIVKKIDKNKQGEVLQLSKNNKGNRKIYIESYLQCISYILPEPNRCLTDA